MSDRDRLDRGASEGWRPSGKQIGGGVLALLAVVFVLQNTEQVRIHLLAWNIDAQLWIVLAAMFLVGAAAAVLFQWHGRRRD